MEDDEHFLNFIKEIFNPYVREERSNWKLFFDNINDLLKTDGYELYEESKISGRSIYNWKRIDSIKKKNDKVINLNMIGQGSYANVYYYKDPDYDKRIVLITNDHSLTSLAAGVKMPVARNLQSKPEVPVLEEPEFDDGVIDGNNMSVGDFVDLKGSNNKDQSLAEKISSDIVIGNKKPEPQEKNIPDKKSPTSKTKIPDFNKFRKRFYWFVIIKK